MATGEQTRRVPPRPPPPTTQSQSSTNDSISSVASIKTFQDLQNVHDKAHSFVNLGLEADERNSTQVALDSYSEGMRLIDIALRVDCDKLCSQSPSKSDGAKQMQQKMMKTKQQIASRLEDLQRQMLDENNHMARLEADAPPSYEEAMSEASTPSASDFLDDEMMALGDSLMERDQADSQTLTNATNLFTIEDGVQIFFISPDGLVSAPSYPSPLHVVKLPEDQSTRQNGGNTSPPAFLHVDDWVYPLVPGSSPALETRYGAYVFPDLMASQPGSAVGLVLPDNLPPGTRQKFEQIIRSFTVYETQSMQEAGSSSQQQIERNDEATSSGQSVAARQGQGQTDTYTRVSKGIVVAADWIAWGLSKGAEKAGELLKAGSEKIRERTSPSDQDRKVDPRIKKGLICARKASHVTVQVTGYLVTKLGEATSALAREIAPHLKQRGEKLLPQSVKKTDPNGKSKIDGFMEVAASGLQGFGTVYVSLETAAKTLGRSLANETVNIVHHKYGAEAGHVTENTVYAAGNAAMTAFNANNFGVKAIAKRTAKDTGKALVSDMNKNKTDHRGYVPCESSDSGVDQRTNGADVRGLKQ